MKCMFAFNGVLYFPMGTRVLLSLYHTNRLFFSTIKFEKCIFSLDGELYYHTPIKDQLIN